MKILSFGSLNIDNVYSVDHFVRPGETISALNKEVFCGGKGLNQTIAIARAGVKVYHAGKVGPDGDILVNCLKHDGVDTGHILRGDQSSGHSIIQLDKSGSNCIIVYGGTNTSLTKEEIEQVLADFGPGDLLLMQNEINLPDVLMQLAAAKGMQIALNPSPINTYLLEKCPLHLVRYFILNEGEGETISGAAGRENVMAALKEKYPDSAIVLTLGSHGVLYCDQDNTFSHGIYNTPVVDTTGAGDTFTGYFLAGVAQQLPMEDVLEQASIASSIAVSRKGAAASIPYIKEVREFDRSLYMEPTC